jgi:hypothetical protein
MIDFTAETKKRERREAVCMLAAALALMLAVAHCAGGCVPARPAATFATKSAGPDPAWCRTVQARSWTLSATTQGLGALAASVAIVAATQDGDRVLVLSLSGAVLAAAGVATANLAASHGTAYAEQCGPGRTP